MTAETEVCMGPMSEVVGIEEKSGLSAGSVQDLATTDFNDNGYQDQASDPENSCVMVIDVDDPSDESKDMAAVDGSSRHESSAPVEFLGSELDARIGELESVNATKSGSAEGGDESFTLVNGIPAAKVISIVDGDGERDTVEEKNKCLEELNHQNGKFVVLNGEVNPTLMEGEDESFTLVNSIPAAKVISIVDGDGERYTVEEKNKCLEELNHQNGKFDVVNGEVNPTLVEGGDGNVARNNKNPLVANGILLGLESSVQDGDVGKPECRSESEIKKDDDSNGKIEQSEEYEVAKFEDQNAEIGDVADAEDQLISEASPSVEVNQGSKFPNLGLVADSGEEHDTVDEKNKCLEELNHQNGQFDVVNGEVNPTLMEGGDGNVARNNENPLVANGILVGLDSSVQDGDVGKPECRAESEIKKDENSNGDVREHGLMAESEIKKDENSNGKIERSEESEVAKFEDQNGEIGDVADAELDEVEDQLISEASPSVEENQESKFPNLGLVAVSAENEAESSCGKEAMQDHRCDIDPESNIQCGLDKGKDMVSNADCHAVRTACDEVLEGKDQIFGVPHVEGSITHLDDAVKPRYDNGATPGISVSEREFGASEQTQNLSASSAEVHKPTTEVQISDAETVGVKSSSPVDGSKSESFRNEPIHLDSLERCTMDGVNSGSDSAIRAVVSDEKEPVLQGSELSRDSEEGHNPSVSAVKLEPEVHNSSAADHVTVTSDKDATSGADVLDSFILDKSVSNSMIDSAVVEDMVSGAIGGDDETLLLAKNRDTGNSHSVDISMATPESSSDTIAGEDVSGVTVRKPFGFFVRMPRYSDEELQEQIRIAELEVEEKTKLRDSILAQIQEKKAKNQSNGVDYECAKGEDRSIKKLLKEKRMEIDSLRSVINKAKNAISFEDLNGRIKTIEHRIQHETLPLKEEKKLIHEIKQLKQHCEQLSSSMCSKNEIQQALEQREQAEERLKTLSKELGNLKERASKAQTASDEAVSKYNYEHENVKELQTMFRAANDVRQEAYAKLRDLSENFYQKRKNFSKCKNDSATATYYAFTDDREALYDHCVNEVENFMELWNGKAEFRKEYVRLNTRSTLRRFGTLDGRSVGPDEQPPILPSYVRERNDKMVSKPANADSVSQSPAIELKPETTIEKVSSDTRSSKKGTGSKNKTVITEGLVKSKLVNNLATVSDMDEIQEEEKEPMKTKEELELIRKAEEIRREEAEAKLKELHRLEEIAKSQEAREKKKRREEKAQRREELRAKKEAELKEKEREKRLRKKERRKAVSTPTSNPTDVQDDTSSAACVEISKDTSIQLNEHSAKKPKTSWVAASKRHKTRSVPPPSLHNRNRKKWQQWMWVSLITLVVVVLFWLGNMGVFFNVNSKLQGFGF